MSNEAEMTAGNMRTYNLESGISDFAPQLYAITSCDNISHNFNV